MLPGRYATEINIHNPSDHDAAVGLRTIPLVLAGAPVGRDPRAGQPGPVTVRRLPPHGATMTDCCRLIEGVLGAHPGGAVPITIGILEIVSLMPLGVTAVYTAAGADGAAPTMQVVLITAGSIPG